MNVSPAANLRSQQAYRKIQCGTVDGPSDEQLLSEYLAGQRGSFELLVRRYSDELYQFVLRFTNSSAAADDVVQDTFVQVHLAAASFDRDRRFKPWLFTIAANKARDWLRARSRRREVPLDASLGRPDEAEPTFAALLADDSPLPSDEMELAEKRHLVRRAVDQLSPNLKEILVLAYYHRFPYKEMAEILEIPLGTVKSRLHAAVAAFGKVLCSLTQTDENSIA